MMTSIVNKVINDPWLQRSYPHIVGMVLAIITFITIFVIIALSIEWDGSKPGGWGYFTAGISIPAISFISAYIMYLISNMTTIMIITYKVKNELNKNPEKAEIYKKKISGYEDLFI